MCVDQSVYSNMRKSGAVVGQAYLLLSLKDSTTVVRHVLDSTQLTFDKLNGYRGYATHGGFIQNNNLHKVPPNVSKSLLVWMESVGIATVVCSQGCWSLSSATTSAHMRDPISTGPKQHFGTCFPATGIWAIP